MVGGENDVGGANRFGVPKMSESHAATFDRETRIEPLEAGS